MKKLLSLFVAALFGVTMYAAEAVKVYFVNADGWTKVNAYMWADGNKKNADWPGVEMTKTAAKAHDFDVYEYEVPDGFENILFNDGTSQTIDLKFAAAKPYYFNYKWYASLAEVEAAPATVEMATLYYVNKDDWTKVNAYVFEGGAKYKAWPGEEMTKTADKAMEKDIYSYEFPAIFTKIIFNDGTNQTADLAWEKTKPYFYAGEWFATKEDIKEPEPKDPVLQIAGTWDEKDGNWVLNPLTVATDKKTASYEVTLEKKDYEFKMIKDGVWVSKNGGENNYELKRDWNGVAGVVDEAKNLKLVADAAGKYVFTWTFENDSLGITFPDKPAPDPTAKFFVTGDSALVVDAGLAVDKKWNADAIKSEKDTLVLNLKKDVDYLLKVTLDGTFDEGKVKGYTDLTDKTNLVKDKDNNIGFKLKADGEVKVVYFVESEVVTFKVLGDFLEVVAPTYADGYYLIRPNWAIEDIVAEEKFAENAEKAGEYLLEVELAVDQEIKVVEVKDNAIKTWFPDGVDNALKIEKKYAGKKTVYFNPTKQEGWLAEGFIFIEENAPEPSPIVETYFATGSGWAPDNESKAEWDGVNERITVTIALDKEAQWQAQVKYQGPKAEDGKCYHVALKMKANHNVEKVTLKWQDDNNTPNVIYENQSVNLEADKEFAYDKTVKGVLGEKGSNGIMVFDFGFAKAGDIIEIYGIVIEEVECPAEPAGTYYLVGNMTDWKVVAEEKYLFTLTETAGQYKLATTLEAGNEFKVVGTDGGEKWYPDGMGNNYVVDADHAGAVTILFRPDGKGGEGWHEGYIFVQATQGIDNTAIDTKAVKFFENGQLIILKNGVKYNAQGTVIR